MRGGLTGTIVAIAVLSISCAGGERRRDGPLEGGRDSGSLCVPAVDGVVSLGEPFKLVGTRPVKVDDFALSRANEVRLVGASLVPLRGGNAIGSAVGYPPPADQLSETGFGWNERQTVGGRITASVLTWELVVGLALDKGAAKGTVGALVVRYSQDGVAYEVLTTDKITIQRAFPCP